jgi:hypothetical protein
MAALAPVVPPKEYEFLLFNGMLVNKGIIKNIYMKGDDKTIVFTDDDGFIREWDFETKEAATEQMNEFCMELANKVYVPRN